MIFLSRTGGSCCFVQLLATLVTWSARILPVAAYFQATGGVYRFSIPSFNDAEKRNQYDAQIWCNVNQSKLLEIRNKDIQAFTISFIANAMNKNQMSGNTVMTNGKRSNSGLTWVNGIRYSGDPTVYGQDSGYSHSYVYVQVTQSGFQFVADTPTAKRSYICEGSPFCSNGFRASGRCYSITRDMSSWCDARNQCIDRGGDLASFDFINDNTGFNALNGSGLNPSSTYWIGFTRQNWTWQDSNSEAKYSQWSGDHPYYPDGLNDPTPYKECLCLLSNPTTYDWLWSECDCTQTYQFVCMTGTTSVSDAPSLTSDSPVSVSPSTTVRLTLETARSLGAPSSVSNSESMSTTAVANATSASSCPSSVSSNSALAVGLGVGLGIGIPLTAVILILALMIAQLKRKLKSFEANRNIPFDGVSTPAAAKEGSAATYESLRNDRQITDNRTYAELNTLNTLENRQNTNV